MWHEFVFSTFGVDLGINGQYLVWLRTKFCTVEADRPNKKIWQRGDPFLLFCYDIDIVLMLKGCLTKMHANYWILNCYDIAIVLVPVLLYTVS